MLRAGSVEWLVLTFGRLGVTLSILDHHPFLEVIVAH